MKWLGYAATQWLGYAATQWLGYRTEVGYDVVENKKDLVGSGGVGSIEC